MFNDIVVLVVLQLIFEKWKASRKQKYFPFPISRFFSFQDCEIESPLLLKLSSTSVDCACSSFREEIKVDMEERSLRTNSNSIRDIIDLHEAVAAY